LARLPKALGGTDEIGENKERLPSLQHQRGKASDTINAAQEKLRMGSFATLDADQAQVATAQKAWDQIDSFYQATKRIAEGNIPTIAERAERIQKEGVRVGFDNGGAGMTAAQWRQRAAQQTGESLDAASKAARGFTVEDVLGAGPAMTAAKNQTAAAAFAGNRILPKLPPAASRTGQGRDTWGTFAGFGDGALQSGGLSTVGGMSKAYKSGGYNETYINEEARAAAAGKDKTVELGKPGVLDNIEKNTEGMGANK
jgi:hypothetical protein